MVSLDYYGTPDVFDRSLTPGTQFSINLIVDYVEKLWGYQFELSFNPAVLHGVSVQNGPFLESAGGTATVVPGKGFNNTEGTLDLYAAALFPIKNFPTGGGMLAKITFEVKGYGESPITLGPETGLANRTGGWIIHKEENPECFVDAYFDNKPPPPGMSLDLVGRSAWPEHHHFVLSKDGDPSVDDGHGTPGYQTLYGKVENTGNVTIAAGTYKVVWKISNSTGFSRIARTNGTLDLAPGETAVLTYDVSALDLAPDKYYVEAWCYYYYTMKGEKTKTFSFAVVS